MQKSGNTGTDVQGHVESSLTCWHFARMYRRCHIISQQVISKGENLELSFKISSLYLFIFTTEW